MQDLRELLMKIARENIEKNFMYESDVEEALLNISKIYKKLTEGR